MPVVNTFCFVYSHTLYVPSVLSDCDPGVIIFTKEQTDVTVLGCEVKKVSIVKGHTES